MTARPAIRGYTGCARLTSSPCAQAAPLQARSMAAKAMAADARMRRSSGRQTERLEAPSLGPPTICNNASALGRPQHPVDECLPVSRKRGPHRCGRRGEGAVQACVRVVRLWEGPKSAHNPKPGELQRSGMLAKSRTSRGQGVVGSSVLRA